MQEFVLTSTTTTASASEISLDIVETVSAMVNGLQRINARRGASRSALRTSSISAPASGAGYRGAEASIPHLSSGFAYVAWLG
jgi:hypothetical protein